MTSKRPSPYPGYTSELQSKPRSFDGETPDRIGLLTFV